jgi:hypothetical protein
MSGLHEQELLTPWKEEGSPPSAGCSAPGTPNSHAPASTLAEVLCVELTARDELPLVCLGCEVATSVRRRAYALVWRSPVLMLLGASTGPLSWLLLRWLLRRTAYVRLPLCEPCEAAWLRPSWAPGTIMVGACLAGVAMLTATLNGGPGLGAGIACGSVVAGRIAWAQCAPKRRPRLRHISGAGVVTLDGVHKAAAAAIRNQSAPDK